MIWKITCYNGTVWEATYQMSLIGAIERFQKSTGFTQLDIKLIERYIELKINKLI